MRYFQDAWAASSARATESDNKDAADQARKVLDEINRPMEEKKEEQKPEEK